MVQWFILHHRRHRFDPQSGTKIPHAYTEQSKILFKEKYKGNRASLAESMASAD